MWKHPQLKGLGNGAVKEQSSYMLLKLIPKLKLESSNFRMLTITPLTSPTTNTYRIYTEENK